MNVGLRTFSCGQFASGCRCLLWTLLAVALRVHALAATRLSSLVVNACSQRKDADGPFSTLLLRRFLLFRRPAWLRGASPECAPATAARCLVSFLWRATRRVQAGCSTLDRLAARRAGVFDDSLRAGDVCRLLLIPSFAFSRPQGWLNRPGGDVAECCVSPWRYGGSSAPT